MQDSIQSDRSIFLGLSLISLATLMYELLLVRILSVTMTPQLAFVAISIVMFGMTTGAILVYLLPFVFKPQRLRQTLTLSAWLFAFTGIVCMYVQLQTSYNTNFDPSTFPALGLMAAVMSVPFIMSGICICLALTSFTDNIGKLYAADLSGASLGCILLPLTFKVMDGITAVIFISFLASLGAASFAWRWSPSMRKQAIVFAGFVLVCVPLNLYTHTMKIEWMKGHRDSDNDYVRWNPYSRVRFSHRLDGVPFCWSLSSKAPVFDTAQIYIDIDSAAGTIMPGFDGDLQKLTYLKYDLTNVGHYLRKNANVLVIGVGGGRDILSALVFGQRQVTAVEINEDIIDLLRTRYADFTHVAFDPRVRLVNDEARSYVAATRDSYDFIHISLVDTFAATSSGAYTFSENSIYTVEAWRLFLEKLTPNGILSFSHWYESDPATFYNRILCLACTALRQEHVQDPRKHIILISNRYKGRGVATLLISRSPFSGLDMATARQIAKTLAFTVVVDPEQSSNREVVNIIEQSGSKEFLDKFDYRMDAPTDDNPFVFCSKKYDWHVIFEPDCIEGAPLAVVGILSLIGIILPLLFSGRKVAIARCFPYFLYFAAIGFGFMLFEISQLEKWSVFLGHPNYALSVVLTTLLLSTGIGSYLTQTDMLRRANPRYMLVALILSMVLYGLLTTSLLSMFQSSPIALRISISVLCLAPVGLTLGIAFPLGISSVSAEQVQLTPWLWGINGAAGVMASVIAVLIAMTAGINLVLRIAVFSYLLALLAFLLFPSTRRKGLDLDRSLAGTDLTQDGEPG